MRVLVAGNSLRVGTTRIARAAAGLALRGHEVTWAGPRPDFPAGDPVSFHAAGSGALRLARRRADVVIGGGGPGRAAVAGWLAGVRCLVLDLDPDALPRWGPGDHALWHSLHSWGLIEERAALALRGNPLGLDLDRVALWPAGDPPPAPDAAHPDTEVLERTCERALARQRGGALRRAVFLDRDGTLVVERGYLAEPSGIELLPGVLQALHELRAAGLALIVVSNQSGVGRGLYSLARAHEIMARLRVVAREGGVELDGIYFCPHRPEERCACRKPGIGLLERAAEDHRLALRGSFVVGDKRIDVETAKRARARGVLVRSGYGREEESGWASQGDAASPDLVCDDLAAAAAWIVSVAEGADLE